MARKAKPAPTPHVPVRPVMVHWQDSMGAAGWHHAVGEADLRCVSIGHLVQQTRDRVTLAMNLNSYQTGEVIEIPRCAVTAIVPLVTEPV